jgi:DNA-binding SARP family transcriptional activator
MGVPTLHIRLLGELDLRSGKVPLPPLESARAGSLLAYLLLHRAAPQPRQHLAFLLWPDSTESQARTNLRHVLHNLRHALTDLDRFLDVTAHTLQWRADAPCWLDVAAFEEALARAEAEPPDSELAALRDAVELYVGDLLAGWYDEWLLADRERLRQRYLATLERLIALHETRGEHLQAIQDAERLLRHDPLHEESYRLLMRLYDARGDRARALRVYHACTATLERELGVEPSAATRAVYEALLPVERKPSSEAADTDRLAGTPFIGRAAERAQLTELWRTTERRQAQFVLVTGEPGVGKTRLIEEFRSWCASRGALTSAAHSYAAEGALAYSPVVTWLRSEALRPRLDRLDRVRLSELSRLLPELLTEVPGLVRPEPLLDPDERQRLFDAAARAVLASGAPLLLVADDLHWSDRETLQFLHFLIRVAPDAPLLIAATARREEIDDQNPLTDLLAGLHRLSRLTEIELGRLTRDETAILAQRLTGRPAEELDADQLYRETEGNPLFVVEALRAGWKSGYAGRGWTSPKVQAVITSRLQQLSEPARDLVGIAATIGREFTSEVIMYASEASEETLVRSLDELWRRRIIREQSAEAYDFSHDKVREVAYLALSLARRRHHHLRVARALEQLYALDSGPVSGQIASHYERAGASRQAVRWYERAVEAAQQVYAHSEAIRLLERALDLLRTLPKNPERDARELEILTAFLGFLAAVDAFTSSRIADMQRHALELARALGVEPSPPLLRSLALASLANDDFETARAVGWQLHARAEREADDMLLVEAEYVLGIAAFWSVELDAARRHFEAAVARCRPEHRHAHLLRYAQDTKVICLSRLANTLWFLGYPEAAARARDAALALADELGHRYSRVNALWFSALLALEMRDREQLRENLAALWAGRLADEAKQSQLASEAAAGYLDVLDGRKETGIARIESALADAELSQHAPGGRAVLMRVLLEAYATTREVQAGLAAADRSLAIGGTRLYEAEVRRLRAELLAALGASSQDIEAELGRALEIARRQGAKMFELRTMVSLLRHQIERGDSYGASEARARLAELIEALPEGRDAPEAREATTLLTQT